MLGSGVEAAWESEDRSLVHLKMRALQTCILKLSDYGQELVQLRYGRGLMGAPKLLLLDEPSLGLSPILVKENFNTVRRINEQGVTVFLVEQNVRQTLAIADYGYVLSKGRVVAHGTPEVLGRTKEVHEAYFG